MTVFVVCRYNQARSIIGAAAIRKFYPELDVRSAGVEAIENIPLPSTVLAVANEWGLSVVEKSSTHFSKIAVDILPTDLIIAADDFVEQQIKIVNPAGTIINFANATGHAKLNAVDPSSMGQSHLRIELAKSVAASLLAARKYKNDQSNIFTVIPDSESQMQGFRQKIWAIAESEKAIVIDASLRANELREWVRLGITPHIFDTNFDLDQSWTPEVATLFAPKHEFADVPRYLMSYEFAAFLKKISQKQKTYLLTPAADSLRYLPDVALSAWHGAIYNP